MTLTERLAAARDDRRVAAGLPPRPAPQATVHTADGEVVERFADVDLHDAGIVIDLRDRPRGIVDGLDEHELFASFRDPNSVLAYDWVPPAEPTAD